MLTGNRRLHKSLKILDILFTILAFLLACLLNEYLLHGILQGIECEPLFFLYVLLMIVIIWHLVFRFSNIYSFYLSMSHFQKNSVNIVRAIIVCVIILLFVFYLFGIEKVSVLNVVIFIVLNLFFLLIYRYIIYKFSWFFHDKKYLRFDVLLVLVGSRTAARELVENILKRNDSKIRIVGCIDTDKSRVGREIINGVKVVGTLDDLDRVLIENAVDEIVFAMPINEIDKAEIYFRLAETMGISIRILPPWYLRKFLRTRPHFYSVNYEDFFGVPTFLLSPAPGKKGTLMLKSLMDYVLAIVILLVFSPLLLIISLSVKIASPGPVLFRQKRCGLYGRVFTMYKFRTMVSDAEMMRYKMTRLNEAMGPVFKIKDDPRIIPYIGRFLRKTALDELPQLYNVLRGEMSLVGPRPPIPEEVEEYDLWQRRRLSMKPGLTCIWQITPDRNDIDFEEWMLMDLEYIDNWSLSLDLKIFFKTARAVMAGSGR
jgi:exopolysaccharide biosynthesis polyprenyl glycosylphosphotransferase